MLDRYGMAVLEERLHDRRWVVLEDYLQREYGSASGMSRYIAEANHTSSPRPGLRAFLAKIAGMVTRSSSRATTPAASVAPVSSEDCADHVAPQGPKVAAAASVRPLRYSRSLNARPRTALPPLKR